MQIDRIWAMPNKWTFSIKPIAELLKQEVGGAYGLTRLLGRNPQQQLQTT